MSLAIGIQSMKFISAVSTAVISVSLLFISSGAEARNRWFLAGEILEGDQTVAVFARPIDRSGAIRRYQRRSTDSDRHHVLRADCSNRNVIIYGEAMPVRQGSISEAELGIVCR